MGMFIRAFLLFLCAGALGVVTGAVTWWLSDWSTGLIVGLIVWGVASLLSILLIAWSFVQAWKNRRQIMAAAPAALNRLDEVADKFFGDFDGPRRTANSPFPPSPTYPTPSQFGPFGSAPSPTRYGTYGVPPVPQVPQPPSPADYFGKKQP